MAKHTFSTQYKDNWLGRTRGEQGKERPSIRRRWEERHQSTLTQAREDVATTNYRSTTTSAEDSVLHNHKIVIPSRRGAREDTNARISRSTHIGREERISPIAREILANKSQRITLQPLVAEKQQVLQEPSTSRRIHVLGTEAFGNFVAHSLSTMTDSPEITLLLHQPHKFQQWYDEGKSIECMRNYDSDFRTGFNVEYSYMQYQPDPRTQRFTAFDRSFAFLREKENWIIDKLIVTTAPNMTVPALRPLRQRLGPASTICFPDHNMAVIDHVNAKIFPDPAMRPRYILGMSSHRLWPTSRNFGVLQASKGRMSLTTLPVSNRGKSYLTFQETSEEDSALDLFKSTIYAGRNKSSLTVTRPKYGYTASSTTLLKTFTNCEALDATGIPYDMMMQEQWQRLAIDSVINPLSVVFDCEYKMIGRQGDARKLMSDLLSETLEVIYRLPEFQDVPINILRKRFSIRVISGIILNLLQKLDHTSMMLQQVRRGERTDIKYLNGYIVKRGNQVGIHCPVHTTVMQQVQAKQEMRRHELEGDVPFST